MACCNSCMATLSADWISGALMSKRSGPAFPDRSTVGSMRKYDFIKGVCLPRAWMHNLLVKRRDLVRPVHYFTCSGIDPKSGIRYLKDPSPLWTPSETSGLPYLVCRSAGRFHVECLRQHLARKCRR